MSTQSAEKAPLFSDEMEKGFNLTLAVEEAARCLLCFDAPCSQACPAGTDPGSFIRKTRFRNVTGAIRTIKQNNPFGWSCGVVCPTAKLCELACSRTAIDRSIQIGKLQRFLIEHGWAIGFQPVKKVAEVKEKVAVVGSGPAGLTCARELSLKGYEVTVFEKKNLPGGNLRYGIPSFRLSTKGLEKEINEIVALGVSIKTNSPVEGTDGLEKLKQQGFKAVFFSPGLWNPIRLNIEGSALEGVVSATAFLNGLNTSDSALETALKGKVVAVIGGGSVAMDAAEWAVKAGAEDVYLLYRRSYTQMPAEGKEKIQVLNNGIHFLILTQPVKYNGSDHLESISCRRTRLGAPDASGRRRPEEIPGTEFEITADFAIEALASRSEEGLQDLAGISWNNAGLVEVSDETLQTSSPWVYSGGDITRGPALVVEAVADGKRAAQAIMEHLNGKGE